MIIEILDNDHDQDNNHDQDDQKSKTQRARLGSTRGALKMKVGSWSAISLHQMQFFCPIGLSLTKYLLVQYGDTDHEDDDNNDDNDDDVEYLVDGMSVKDETSTLASTASGCIPASPNIVVAESDDHDGEW